MSLFKSSIRRIKWINRQRVSLTRDNISEILENLEESEDEDDIEDDDNFEVEDKFESTDSKVKTVSPATAV
jgi:molybdate-binding protein